jgi:dTDP-4-dehydrorhamnose reductase
MIIVLGKSGQVARALQKVLPTPCTFFSSDQINLADPPQLISSLHKNLQNLAISTKSITTCINAAAYTDVNRAESESELCFNVNSKSPAKIANWCAENHIPLIHYSSDYVYGHHGQSALTEDQPIHPEGVYAESKSRADTAILQSGCTGTILRTSWVYDSIGTNFLTKIRSLLQSRKSIQVVNDQIGSPTFSEDLAVWTKIILEQNLAAEKKTTHCSIVHACNSGWMSWFEFAGLIQTEIHSTCKIIPVSSAQFPSPVIRPTNSRLNLDRLKKLYGIEPRSVLHALKSCLNK